MSTFIFEIYIRGIWSVRIVALSKHGTYYIWVHDLALRIITYPGADPGFLVRGGGTLKKIAPSGGRREIFLDISCEKSRLYAKKSYFFQF